MSLQDRLLQHEGLRLTVLSTGARKPGANWACKRFFCRPSARDTSRKRRSRNLHLSRPVSNRLRASECTKHMIVGRIIYLHKL